MANERKIEFKVQVENLRFRHVKSVDLSAILTNLLDNAIEGSVKVEHRFIEIVICKKRSYETITIKNRIGESVLKKNPKLHTTKVEQTGKNLEHGYGIDQVKALVAPTLIIVSLAFKYELPKDITCFLLFLISIVLGYLILWSISFIVQMTSFFIINVWSISTIKNVFVNILAGVYLPAWFFPDWLKRIVAFTPFDAIFFKPIQIYLGQLSLHEILFSLGKQCFWLTILLLIGDLMLKAGKKKLIVQGG